MPTVILLDNSLSMRRLSCVKEESESLLSIAIKGIDSFLCYMATCFPLDYCSLMVFSSTCESLVPFTRNYTDLRRGLLSVATQDRSDLGQALRSMVDIVLSEWGAFAPCQVIIVTDGNYNQGLNDKTVKFIPFPCRLHVVSVVEVLTTSHFRTWCVANEIPISVSLDKSTIADAFLKIAETYFKPFNGVLKCGHLQSPISLSPSPVMAHMLTEYEFNDGGATQSFPALKMSHPFPNELVVQGFIDTTAISAPAVFSRHFVLDGIIDDECLKNIIKQLQDHDVNDPIKEISSNSDLYDKPSFRVILHGSLKCESKVALVKLSDSWFGLLSSAAAASKKSNLVLTVLLPDTPTPWLGSFSYLGPLSSSQDPRSNIKKPFPVSVHHNLSYQSLNQLYWIKAAGLQADLTKIARYSKKLPEKEHSLVKELNKVRLQSMTYSFPSLLDAVCQILASEEAVCKPAVKPLIQSYIRFLSSNHNPQDKLTHS